MPISILVIRRHVERCRLRKNTEDIEAQKHSMALDANGAVPKGAFYVTDLELRKSAVRLRDALDLVDPTVQSMIVGKCGGRCREQRVRQRMRAVCERLPEAVRRGDPQVRVSLIE